MHGQWNFRTPASVLFNLTASELENLTARIKQETYKLKLNHVK